MKQIIALLLLCLVSCTAVTEPPADMATAVPTRTPIVEEEIAVTRTAGPTATPVATATPVVCTAVPFGMGLVVTPLSDTEIEIQAVGMKPGELPILLITGLHPDGQTTIEASFEQSPVDENGRYIESSINLYTHPPAQPETWQIQLVHARGVACLQFTMPAQTTFQVAGATPTPLPTSTAVPLPTDPPPPQPTNGPSNIGWSNMPVLSTAGRVMAFTSNGRLTADAMGEAYASNMRAYLFDQDTRQLELVSKTLNGGGPFDNIYQVAMSGNGRVLAYYSFDSTITGDDPDLCTANDWSYPCEDLFIYDRQTGQTERIPRGRTSGLGADYTVALSADGQLVAYGEAGNLLLYDRETDTASPLLITTDGQPPNGETLAPVIADNGDITFVSRASNLVAGDTNETYDVFVWDSATGQATRISQTSGGTEADGMSGLMLHHEGFSPALDISADGRFVAFASSASTLTTETLAECQEQFRDDYRPCFNIYLHDRQTGETGLITNGEGDSTSPTLSGDGRTLAFTTVAADLVDITSCTGQMSFLCWQIFLLDTQTGELTLVSQGPDGLPAVGNNWSPQLSADGRTLAFASDANNYVPDDTANNSDIFLYDQETGQIDCISVPNE